MFGFVQDDHIFSNFAFTKDKLLVGPIFGHNNLNVCPIFFYSKNITSLAITSWKDHKMWIGVTTSNLVFIRFLRSCFFTIWTSMVIIFTSSWVLSTFGCSRWDFELHWYQIGIQFPLKILMFQLPIAWLCQFQCYFMCFIFNILFLCYEQCNHIHYIGFSMATSWILFIHKWITTWIYFKKMMFAKNGVNKWSKNHLFIGHKHNRNHLGTHEDKMITTHAHLIFIHKNLTCTLCFGWRIIKFMLV